MNKRPATRLMLAVASLLFTPISAFAADSPSPAEKSKLIEPAAKPAIAKPSDALVSKSKDGKQAEVKQVEAKITDAKENISQTPAGRPINDLKVTPGALTAPKTGSMPRAGVTPAVEGQSSAADPLEEKVRVLLQDKLGKDGEVVLRVSPDTPVAKAETSPTARGRVAAAKTTERTKSGDTSADATAQHGADPSDRHGMDSSRSALSGDAKNLVGSLKVSSDVSKQAAMHHNALSDQHQPWDWSGSRGPHNWGRLDPSYSTCSSGKMQSPPSITEQEPIAAIGPAMPALNWQHQGFNWSRQGPLWTANLAGNSQSSFRGEMFSLDSIQFRFPGEPFIGKKAPAGAVHLIHRHGTRFLIIAVPLEIDDRSPRNPAISTLLRRFPFDSNEKLSWTGLQIDARSLLPSPMQAAVLFSGSLSHPPCTESVLWLLAQRSLSVPRAQLIELSTLLGEGVRPQQALNGRPVLGLHSNNP